MALLPKPTITPQSYMRNGVKRIQWCVYCGRQNGKDVVFYRSTKAKAQLLADEFAAKAKVLGALATKLTAEQTMDAANALRMLSEAGQAKTLTETVGEWLGRKGGASTRACALSAALVSYLGTFDTSKEHFRTTRRLLHDMFKHEEQMDMLGVTCAFLTERLARHETPSTYNAYRGAVLTFLRWAVAIGVYPYEMLTQAETVPKKKVPYTPRHVMAAADVETVLRWAERQTDAETLVPRFAVAFFAGIRSDEIHRMKWGDVRFKDKIIRIESPKGKEGTPPRVVTLQDNLAAWLKLYQLGDEEPLCMAESRFFARSADMRKATGIAIARNAARHTCLTAHLAKWRSLAKTADEAGHGENTDTTKRHYLGRMDVEDAERYWNIRPS